MQNRTPKKYTQPRSCPIPAAVIAECEQQLPLALAWKPATTGRENIARADIANLNWYTHSNYYFTKFAPLTSPQRTKNKLNQLRYYFTHHDTPYLHVKKTNDYYLLWINAKDLIHFVEIANANQEYLIDPRRKSQFRLFDQLFDSSNQIELQDYEELAGLNPIAADEEFDVKLAYALSSQPSLTIHAINLQNCSPKLQVSINYIATLPWHQFNQTLFTVITDNDSKISLKLKRFFAAHAESKAMHYCNIEDKKIFWLPASDFSKLYTWQTNNDIDFTTNTNNKTPTCRS